MGLAGWDWVGTERAEGLGAVGRGEVRVEEGWELEGDWVGAEREVEEAG